MKVYTQNELAERWHVSVRTVERMRAPHGPLHWLRIGGQVRFTQEQIEEYEASVLAVAKEKVDEPRPAPNAAYGHLTGPEILAAMAKGKEIARRINGPPLTIEEWAEEAVRKARLSDERHEKRKIEKRKETLRRKWSRRLTPT